MAHDYLFCLLIEKPACDVSAALHQVEIVELCELVLLICKGFDDTLFGIVNEYHDMGEFNGSALTYLDAGRYTLDNGGFCCPYLRFGTLVVLVLFKVDTADDTCPYSAIGLNALNIYHSIFVFFKNALFKILLHGAVYLVYPVIHAGLFKVHLGKYQVIGALIIAYVFFNSVPVLGFRGILVAGNYCPLVHIRILGQKDIRPFECC